MTPESEEYLKACTHTNPMDLEHEFTRVSADIAYWNARAAEALEAYLRAKLARKRLDALLHIDHRTRTAEKKTTEAHLSALVTTDPRMGHAEEEELAAEVDLKRVQGICEAIRTKKDMLVSLGANMRAELASDPILRNTQRTARGS